MRTFHEYGAFRILDECLSIYPQHVRESIWDMAFQVHSAMSGPRTDHQVIHAGTPQGKQLGQEVQKGLKQAIAAMEKAGWIGAIYQNLKHILNMQEKGAAQWNTSSTGTSPQPGNAPSGGPGNAPQPAASPVATGSNPPSGPGQQQQTHTPFSR
jgi:hypothetical protein